MNFHFVKRHVDVSEAICKYAEQKIGEQVEKFIRNPINVHVVFSQEANMFTVHCDLVTGNHGHDIHVNHKDEDYQAAIDKIVDKLKTTLRKEKEKASASQKPKRIPKVAQAEQVLHGDLEDEDEV